MKKINKPIEFKIGLLDSYHVFYDIQSCSIDCYLEDIDNNQKFRSLIRKYKPKVNKSAVLFIKCDSYELQVFLLEKAENIIKECYIFDVNQLFWYCFCVFYMLLWF